MDKIENLHNEILEKVKEYYSLVHKTRQKAIFKPGIDRINYAGRVFNEHEMCNLVDSALEFWLSGGRYSNEFEAKLSEWLGVNFALSVNSGSSANLLAFMTLTSPLLNEQKINRGDEVITVAAGFPTTVSPIVQFGAVPVFVDIEPGTANIDTEKLESAYSSKTKLVMIAHTLGNPFNLKKVTEFCRKHQLWLIEDNCDALGSKFANRFTGTWGDLATSSFYPAHHITTGEGGAVYTNNPLLEKIARSMRDWGRDCHCNSGQDNCCGNRFTGQFGTLPDGYDHKYVYSHLGYNLKMSDMQAAVGCAQIEKLSQFVSVRKENFNYLFEHLKNIDELQLFEKYPESDPSWFGFLITINKKANFSRNAITEYLEKNNIQTRNLFAGNLLRHPCFAHLEPQKDYRISGNLINTDNIMNNAFWLGLHPGMTKEKIDFMILKIKEFCKK